MKGMKVLFCTAVLILTVIFAVNNTADALTLPPEAENLEFTVCQGGSYEGKLTAASADGEKLTFVITTMPRKGTVKLNADGSFTYTPDESSRGRDYFGFRAIDSQDIRSQEATVIIRICKNCD